MKQTKKTSFVLRAACVLLCLVLISAHFTSGLYAKYIVSATGSDTGRTASFRVSAAMGDENNGEYTITLQNGSETAVCYSVTVQPDKAGMFSSAKLGNLDPKELDASGAFFTFENVGRIAPGGNDSAVLSLTVDPGYPGSDDASSLLDFSNDSVSSGETELPFTVTVTFVQVN